MLGKINRMNISSFERHLNQQFIVHGKKKGKKRKKDKEKSEKPQ